MLHYGTASDKIYDTAGVIMAAAYCNEIEMPGAKG